MSPYWIRHVLPYWVFVIALNIAMYLYQVTNTP
jgi:hypothetical protein